MSAGTMNGSAVRTYEAEVTKSVTVFGIYQAGSRRDYKKGDLIEVTEDNYGNAYQIDETGYATYVGTFTEEKG